MPICGYRFSDDPFQVPVQVEHRDIGAVLLRIPERSLIRVAEDRDRDERIGDLLDRSWQTKHHEVLDLAELRIEDSDRDSLNLAAFAQPGILNEIAPVRQQRQAGPADDRNRSWRSRVVLRKAPFESKKRILVLDSRMAISSESGHSDRIRVRRSLLAPDRADQTISEICRAHRKRKRAALRPRTVGIGLRVP